MVLILFQECCFDMYADTEQLGPLQRSAPLAGTMLQYNPFLDQHEYSKNDYKPKGFCCRSNHCDLFYKVRPIPTCYRRSPFAPGDLCMYMYMNFFFQMYSSSNRYTCTISNTYEP